MKTITMHLENDKSNPQAILAYDSNITPGELTEIIFTMLEMASEQAGFKLTSDLYEISEEI